MNSATRNKTDLSATILYLKPTPPDPSNPAPEPSPRLAGAAELTDYELLVADRSLRGRLLRWLTNWRIVALLLVAVLTMVGIFAGPRLYRSAKAWRAQHFLAAAKQAQADGDLARAAAAFRSATMMAPYDPRVIRALTYFRAEQGDPAAFPSLKRLVDAREATSDEVLLYASGMIWSGLIDDAKNALSQLPAILTEPQKNRRAIIEIELAAAQGPLDAAIALARTRGRAASGEASDDLRLLLARLLLRGSDRGSKAEIKNEALELLDAVGTSRTRSGLEALRLRSNLALSEKRPATDSALPQKLRAHPLHTPDDTLLAASVEILARPADEKQIVAALTDSRSTAPDAERLAFARWLNRRGAFDDSLAFAGDERIRKNEQWLLVALDALAARGRWEEVRELVEEAGNGLLDDPIRYLFLARASLELGDTAAAEQHWADVHRYARLGKPENLAYVARYAEQIGARGEAAKAYRRLSERKETALNGFLGWLRCLPVNTPAAELLPIYREFLQQFPHLAEVKNDEAYLSLLCNQAVEPSAASAREMLAKYPTMLSFITTAALGELRLGHPDNAEALYAKHRIDWTTAPAPFKAVRIACLRATARQAEADELRKTIREDSLRPEERELLKPGASLKAPAIEQTPAAVTVPEPVKAP